jgi:hypothetical protein
VMRDFFDNSTRAECVFDECLWWRSTGPRSTCRVEGPSVGMGVVFLAHEPTYPMDVSLSL